MIKTYLGASVLILGVTSLPGFAGELPSSGDKETIFLDSKTGCYYLRPSATCFYKTVPEERARDENFQIVTIHKKEEPADRKELTESDENLFVQLKQVLMEAKKDPQMRARLKAAMQATSEELTPAHSE